ncbi:MAG: hypothetical protein ACOYB1_07310 [Limnohabitans sp.]
MNEAADRNQKIKLCLKQLEEIHADIISKKSDDDRWREIAEKSLSQQIAVLRLWQGESRISNNWKIALASLISVTIGLASSALFK